MYVKRIEKEHANKSEIVSKCRA